MFVHLPPHERTRFHAEIIRRLRPGGLLLIEAFSTDQISYTSGGPKDPAQLFTEQILADDLRTMELLQNRTMVVRLNEGPYHTGDASIIRLAARKPLV